MKVAIIGSQGYTGTHLAEILLKVGYRVIGIDNLFYNQFYTLPTLLNHNNFSFFREDIRNTESVIKITESCDVIYVLAALVGAPICSLRPAEAHQVNYEAVKNFVRRMSTNQRLIFPNSNSSYGTSKEICTEESPTNPLSVYAKTKHEAEKVVLYHPNSVSLRLATVYGLSNRPRFDLMVNNWTAKLVLEGKLNIFEGHFKRNFLNIEDLTRCYCWMVEDRYNGIYNVGCDEDNMSKWELAQKIGKILGIPEENITEGVGQDTDKRNYEISNKKLLKINFRFENSLEDGIRSVANFVKIIGWDCLKMGNV